MTRRSGAVRGCSPGRLNVDVADQTALNTRVDRAALADSLPDGLDTDVDEDAEAASATGPSRISSVPPRRCGIERGLRLAVSTMERSQSRTSSPSLIGFAKSKKCAPAPR